MICIINTGTSWLEEITKNISELGHEYKVVTSDEIPGQDFNSFFGIIISGAPTMLTEVDQQKYLDLFAFLKTTKIPVLGICLGHQILGLVYGAKVSRGKTINKKEEIEISKNDPLFSNIKNHSLFLEEHSEYVELPKGFSLLASSASCRNEAMKHTNKYGVQFHPEVSGKNGKQVLKNFLTMCKH